jgi:hypothetical protein
LGDEDGADPDEHTDDVAPVCRVEAADGHRGEEVDQLGDQEGEAGGKGSARQREDREEDRPSRKRAEEDAERGPACGAPSMLIRFAARARHVS